MFMPTEIIVVASLALTLLLIAERCQMWRSGQGRGSTLSCPSSIRLSIRREKPLDVSGDRHNERFDPSG
jgi:hypothetical protein